MPAILKSCRLPAVVLTVLVVSLALSRSLRAQSARELQDRLAKAAETTSLDSANLKPWHLKLDVQLFDPKGQPTDKVTVEEWWQSPTVHRTNFVLPAYTLTSLHTERGRFLTVAHVPAPLILYQLLQQFVHPLPSAADLDSATPEFHRKAFGKIDLDCIMLVRLAKLNGDAHGQRTPLPLGIFPTYCFDPGAPTLRVSYDLGSQAIIRNGSGSFQGKALPTSLTLFQGSARAATAQLSSLRQARPFPRTCLFPVPTSPLPKRPWKSPKT